MPVAQVAYGFGGGFGKGHFKGKAAIKEDSVNDETGEGGGGG